VKWLTPVKKEKLPVQRVRCFSALSSGLTPPTPPPPVIRPPNAAADHQFVGAQLYSVQTTGLHFYQLHIQYFAADFLADRI